MQKHAEEADLRKLACAGGRSKRRSASALPAWAPGLGFMELPGLGYSEFSEFSEFSELPVPTAACLPHQ